MMVMVGCSVCSRESHRCISYELHLENLWSRFDAYLRDRISTALQCDARAVKPMQTLNKFCPFSLLKIDDAKSILP